MDNKSGRKIVLDGEATVIIRLLLSLQMSYLYSMFANQVEEFCEFSELPGCSQELLKFGLRKLKELPEDHLDTMDPYQRGAHGISKCFSILYFLFSWRQKKDVNIFVIIYLYCPFTNILLKRHSFPIQILL